MTNKQLFFLLIAAVVLLAAGTIGVAYGANTLLSQRSEKLATIKATSQALDAQEVQLSKNKKDIITYGELNNIAKTIVPQDKDQAEAVREIVKLAADSGIGQLSSINFPASTLGAIGAGALPSKSGLTQVTPVIGIPGVYDLQITVTQDTSSRVSYNQFTTFLSKLEQNRRTAQVSSISIQPDAQHPDQVAFNLIIDEFIKP